ncbi:hypothetical protein AOL_s00054g102 [Orbilia oligospora ATCC 24927]|uniref:Glucose-methanol-choline oxidoreductase N-terminal domain-containing protein n=1 Tax=Arthrobotrys oligospora (strain ATCC 24927 / CBS 115.81 / DSM 1491) TaxID=756982 RepID=G1X5F8_ARTOA|nr:hypothetical protein AOL_s00054g102 [Orbilia oligospora ATCC 24927]EGX51403.1 hypothetical protein AOL_s00054g102 [Orbilia oligospora ATCC 24927]
MLFTSVFVLVLSLLPGDSAAATIRSRQDASTTSYDFIVIGGGTAGLALATRLGQKLPDTRILILEAGPAPPTNEPGISIPGLKGSTLFGPYDWKFLTTPQENIGNRVIGQSRGRVLGGTSALNFMVWDRAAKAEYDAWGDLGNHGWGWGSMIKYMLKAENYVKTSNIFGLNTGVGKGGPIQTTVDRIQPPQQLPFIPTMNSLGVPTNLESLNGNPIGAVYHPSNIRDSNYTRSWAPEYLSIAGSNIHIVTDATVRKVNLKSTSKGQQATSVTLEDGTVYTATKEVILSAGAFQSPQILETSGIGQSSLLAKAGIKTIINLPGVGENLQDHVYVSVAYQLKPGFTSFDSLNTNSTYAAEQMARYQSNQPSAFDYNGSNFAFLNWKQILGSDNIMNYHASNSATPGNVVDQTKLYHLTSEAVKAGIPQLEVLFADGYTGTKGYPAAGSAEYGNQYVTLLGILQHSFSKGSVHIDTTNPSNPPVIDPNYFSNSYDTEAIKQIVKYLRRVANTAPLKDILVKEYEPGSSVFTDAQILAYAKDTVSTLWHPVGSCAMLPKAQNGVVDCNLKVYGTTNLRIVDASVIPVQISAHIQTAVYGIAERAAVLIANGW